MKLHYALRTGPPGRPFIRSCTSASDLPVGTLDLDDDLHLSSCNHHQPRPKSTSKPDLYVHSKTSAAIFSIHAYIRTISLSASMSAPVNSLSNIAAAGCNLLLNQTPRPISCCTITIYVSTCTHNIIVHSPPGFLHTARPRPKSFLICICSFICLPALAWSLGGHNRKQHSCIRKYIPSTTSKLCIIPVIHSRQTKYFKPLQLSLGHDHTFGLELDHSLYHAPVPR